VAYVAYDAYNEAYDEAYDKVLISVVDYDAYDNA
jgi:hypothetical protein